MTTREQALAILGLTRGAFSIKIRDDGTWYVQAPVEVGGDGFLRSPTEAESTPEEAIRKWWTNHVAALKPEEHLRVGLHKGEWRGRWNGFMWEEINAND